MEKVIDLSRFKYESKGYDTRETFIDYTKERLIAKGKDPLRPWISFNQFFAIVPPQHDPAKITTGQVAEFSEMRLRQGRSPATVVKDLSFVKAALGNAHRRNRIQLLPYIEIEKVDSKVRRPLTEDEFRLVMSKPMSGRLRRFYYMAYYTGHRSRAIEELTWKRFDPVKCTFNFNVPGVIYTNKKRNDAFPIPDEFLPRLIDWHARRKDDYVIGLGQSGRCTSTYHEANYVVRELCGLRDPSLVPRHCMRKMFATEMFDKEADPEIVGWLMADNPNTLRKHYVIHKDEKVRRIANMRSR